MTELREPAWIDVYRDGRAELKVDGRTVAAGTPAAVQAARRLLGAEPCFYAVAIDAMPVNWQAPP